MDTVPILITACDNCYQPKYEAYALKFLVVTSNTGFILFVSSSYAGCTSDEHMPDHADVVVVASNVECSAWTAGNSGSCSLLEGKSLPEILGYTSVLHVLAPQNLLKIPPFSPPFPVFKIFKNQI